jgi:uncharacterized glyoxalase superfamily protein PhnB
MDNLSLIEQLDQAIEVVIANRDAAPARVSEEIAPLARIASVLCDLPRADFKARLKNQLERRISMSTATETKQADEEATHSSVKPIREGFRTVIPYVVVSDVHQEIDFIKQAFGAEGQVYGLGSAGGFHSEFRIGDSTLMIGGGGKGAQWQGTPVPAVFHLYVENVDGVYQQAIQAGAISLMPPADMEYGERSAGIEDGGGNRWYIATATGPSYIPEGVPNLMPYFHPVGASKMIEFLKDAFDAKEVAVYRSPDGVVQHAKISIGESIVEMGEAHGPWQQRPMQFMVYVDDCDQAYARAMKAEGAISAGEPANAPYGGRTGTIKDPFGNTWYLSSQTQKKEGETPRRESMASAKLFRIALQVTDLDKASAFYSKLLDDEGIRIPRGSRHYYNCGPVILALVDQAAGGLEAKPIPDYVYFAVDNLEEFHERARDLGCLSQEDVHDDKAGEIVTRPWGERSFYCDDPWGNGLCFVDEKTLFTGR